MMTDREVKDNYENFWKEIVEHSNGMLNKGQVMKELHDFSTLIRNLSTIYCYMTGNRVSKPMTDVNVVIQLCEEQLKEAYEDGYKDAIKDHLGTGGNDE